MISALLHAQPEPRAGQQVLKGVVLGQLLHLGTTGTLIAALIIVIFAPLAIRKDDQPMAR